MMDRPKPAGVEAGRCAVTYGGQPISSRFDSGGGGADVEKEAVESSAYRDLHGDNSNFTYHKSVLTARLVPERSTIPVDL